MAVEMHPHHTVAKTWFDLMVSDQAAFCRITEMGMLRLLTNPHVMAGSALSAAGAWAVLDQLRGDSRTSFLREPPELDRHWRRTSGAGKIGPNYWTDSYLSCLCAASDCTLITFDRKLANRKTCSVRLLASGEAHP